MNDYKGKLIKPGVILIDKWGQGGYVESKHNRLNWVTPFATYWLCSAIIEIWRLTVEEEK